MTVLQRKVTNWIQSVRDTEGSEIVDINPDLSLEGKKKVTILLEQFSHVLSDNSDYTNLIPHDMKTNSSQTIRVK